MRIFPKPVRRLSASSLLSLSILLGSAFAAGGAHAQSSEQFIAQTQKSVRANLPKAQADLANLIMLLRKSTTMSEQAELIEALRIIGNVHGASPPAIKAYLNEVVPLALLDFIVSRADGRVRGQALLSLRSYDPSDEILDQAIAAARKDSSADRDFVHQQAAILHKWREESKPRSVVAEEKRPVTPEAQKKATEYLQKRKLELDYHTLLKAVADLDPQLIDMLGDAGMEFSGVHSASALSAITAGMNSACRKADAQTLDKMSIVFKTLQKYGFKMDTSDENGNELVMNVVHWCSAPVIGRIVDLGARVNPVNKQNTTPLTWLFVAGEWETAKALIDRGAGMTQQEADTTFMELPEDPMQKELVNRALQNAKK